MSLKEDVVQRLKDEEGFSAKLYLCPANKQTIGYGFNLDVLRMPKAVANLWLEILYDDLDRDIRKGFPNFGYYPIPVQKALMDMVYNMGIDGVLAFKKTIKLIDDKKYSEAAKELLNSEYGRGVTKNRALRNSKLIKGAI